MSLPQIANPIVFSLVPNGPSTPTAMNPAFTTLSVPAQVTNVAISGNVLTVTASNAFMPGQLVYFAGLTNATFLNGQTVQVTGLLGSSPYSGLTATFQHDTYSASEAGSPPTAGAFSVYYFATSGRDLVTLYNSDSVAHYVTIFSAPDDVGRKADVVEYAVPASSGGLPGVSEFLVLSSSYFTQTDGTVRFVADSPAISVLVRNV